MEKIENRGGFSGISAGKVKLVSSYSILHKINPGEIAKSLEMFKNSSEEIKDTHYKNLITTEIQSIEQMIHTLLPKRQKRGIFNGGGRFLNWAFGTLDDEDKNKINEHFEELENDNNEVREAINKQIDINDSVNQTFKQLEHIIKGDRELLLKELEGLNELRNELNQESKVIIKLFTLNSLKHQIQVVQQCVIAARTGSFQPDILSKDEVDKYDIGFEKLRNIKIGAGVYKNEVLVIAIKVPAAEIEVDRGYLTPIPGEKSEQLDIDTEEIVKWEEKYFSYTSRLYTKSIFSI